MSKTTQEPDVVEFAVSFKIPLAMLHAVSQTLTRKVSIAGVGCATLTDADRIAWTVVEAGMKAMEAKG